LFCFCSLLFCFFNFGFVFVLQHIKAIITAEEVLVRDPMDDDVVPVVEELRRRLPVKVSGQGQGEEESCAQDGEENGKIFLFCFWETIQCIGGDFNLIR
jgi:hypothetical protein